MILMGPSQLEIFDDSMIGPAKHHWLLSFFSCCFQAQCEQVRASLNGGGTLMHFLEWVCWELRGCSQ